MRTSWRKFKKLFTGCISPAKEESPVLADEEQLELRLVCKKRRAFRVIQSEYMLYDNILRRRTFLEATKNEVLDAAAHHDEDLLALQRSSDSGRGPSIASLTLITCDSNHMLTGWNVLEGSRLFIINAISEPITSVPPSLELRFLQLVEDHIKVRMVELFGSRLEGTSCMLFHSNTVSRFPQPQQCLLEYTDSEGGDKSGISSGTVYDADIHITDIEESVTEDFTEGGDIKESITEDKSRIFRGTVYDACIYITEIEESITESNEMTLSVQQCLSEITEESVTEDVTEDQRAVLIGAEDKSLAVYKEPTESITEEVTEDESLAVPIGAERSTESIGMQLSVEQCLSSSIMERERIMNEFNKGATLMIGSGQGTMLLLKDIDTEEEVSSLFKQALIRGRNSLKKVPESLLAQVNINPECTYELFMSFEERCPPGGQDCIVLYTTSIHTIRKSFDDCNQIRFILLNLGIKFRERDISIDLGYREDFWNVMGFHANAPGLFIKGRYIGGAKEAIELHENDKLMPLISQFLMDPEERELSCNWCGGIGFMMCASCNGTNKIYDRDCLGCNENGLVPCTLCS